MSRLDALNQGTTPYDAFLYAEVGQDRHDNAVSVLSDLPDEGARTRLAGLLARFTDVPALDRGAALSRLIDLLPRHSGPRGGVSALGFGPVAAVVLLILIFLQSFFLGGG